MKNLETTIAKLKKQAKQLYKDQDAGKNWYGYRDGDNLMQAVAHLEKAMHLIKLTEQ